MGTEKERQDARVAMASEIRLMIKQSEKDGYTKEEILDLLDTVIAETIIKP